MLMYLLCIMVSPQLMVFLQHSECAASVVGELQQFECQGVLYVLSLLMALAICACMCMCMSESKWSADQWTVLKSCVSPNTK